MNGYLGYISNRKKMIDKVDYSYGLSKQHFS